MENILLQLGIILFLIGLLTGFVVPKLANPRMGLASHLQGVLNGMFLAALGLLWQRLNLPAIWLAINFLLYTVSVVMVAVCVIVIVGLGSG